MKKRYLALIILSLFLILSGVNAEELATDIDSSSNILASDSINNDLDLVDESANLNEMDAKVDSISEILIDSEGSEDNENTNNPNDSGLGSDGEKSGESGNTANDEIIGSNPTSNLPHSLNTKNLVKYYKNDSQFVARILDSQNNPVPNVKVSFKIKNKVYNKTTDNNGIASLNINLAPGTYNITTSYNKTSQTNSIKVLSRVSTKNIASTYGTKVKFSLKLLDKQGNPKAKALVTFKKRNNTSKVYTNNQGIASIYLNYTAGKYTINYSVDGCSGKNTYTVKNYYKLTTYKWNSGANVLKNSNIKANVPNSTLVKKVVAAAKNGTPVIMFKGGNGKKVFITAGCHGNEIPSQVAAMKLINYLETHAIKGTVYVMPFMNPKGTAANVRDYNGVHLNKLANKKGTISYKTVQLIKKNKCHAYGDFHATRPGGKPGKDVAMGTYKPTKKSATIAKYISKNAKVKCIIYKKAGAEYPGALEDEVSLKGIPAVTCEVISPHGKIKAGSVAKSLLMMKTLLKYNKII